MIGMTQSGYTGFMLSSYRPKVPLYVFTKHPGLINQMSLAWGIRGFLYDDDERALDTIFSDQIEILKTNGYLKRGDIAVSTGSTPVHLKIPTNTIKITKIEQ
ncbi:hypothetical protein LWM68_29685 [Niabella sp. W65]|nr:hypothetical protein [Niabella sp. W65]MCH7366570.1 hypothetical protein [Niabella sp. W65]ULT42277.1 hypothetical protein KRR40_01135 [Niabella sp. I65]